MSNFEEASCVSKIPEIDPWRAAALGSLWGFLVIFVLALIAPPIVLSFTNEITCTQNNVVPIRAWLLVNSGLWFVLALSAIMPMIALFNDGKVDKKKGCCLGVSFAFLFAMILMIFIWGAIGAATAVQCESTPFPALTAYTVLDFVFSTTLAIWVLIELSCWV